MKIEAIEAKRHHCGQIARRLRPDHAAVIAAHELNAHRNISDFFTHSTFVRAWTIDGELAALAGVTGSSLDADGIAWLALSAEAEKHPIGVSREALRFMKSAMVTKRDISVVVMSEDPASMRFAYFLGFNTDKRTTIDGVPSILMSTRARKAA